jgi:genome maintenance exonuclease 1
MKFNHIPIKTPIMETAHEDNKHYYTIDGLKLPSITTILHSFPNKNIDIWKIRTPNWEEIQKESFEVGNILHKTIEWYLKNESTNIEHNSKIDINSLFENLKPELDKIDNIMAQETRLYHKDLKVAGTVDCIAEFEGERCIIDFKNSRKPKKEWMIKKSGYYEQLTAYSKMWEYCTNQKIDTGIILIANWDGTTSTHKIHIPDYEDNLMSILEMYYEKRD